MSHALQTTCLISLLQPPPETFQLFDDVMMISDGLILYHGKLWQGGEGGSGLAGHACAYSLVYFWVRRAHLFLIPRHIAHLASFRPSLTRIPRSPTDTKCARLNNQPMRAAPVAGVLPFFSSLGFTCPQRKDVPSFLLEVRGTSSGVGWDPGGRALLPTGGADRGRGTGSGEGRGSRGAPQNEGSTLWRSTL